MARPNYYGFDPAPLASGRVLGTGTSTTPAATSKADKTFVKFYTKSTATSGTSRLAYLRHYISGAGAEGEALRAFTTVEAAATGGTHGGHISLSFGTAGTQSGLGLASRSTLHLPNRTVTMGTLAAAQAELYLDGTSSVVTATEMAILRLLVDGGDATQQAKIKNAVSFVMTAGADATGNMLYTHTHTPGDAAGSIRILVNGVAKYLKFWAAE